MSRFAGLPRRTSTDQDRSTITPRFAFPHPTAARTLRSVIIAAATVSLSIILGASGALPSAVRYNASAPAANFAVAGLVGATGDLSVSAAADNGADSLSGTFSFGDPIIVPPSLNLLPPGPTPTPGSPSTAPNSTPVPVTAPAPNSAPPSAPAPEPAAAPAAPANNTPASDPDAPYVERGLKVSAFARKLVGYPYRWGAAGPRAFDCSGLTLYVYRQFGINLPHKASLQYSTRYGRRIASMSDLKPGDLVFFRNTAGPGLSHSAIYVGNGMMVTANNPRQGVRYQTITTSYWRSHWAGGIRPSL